MEQLEIRINVENPGEDPRKYRVFKIGVPHKNDASRHTFTFVNFNGFDYLEINDGFGNVTKYPLGSEKIPPNLFG